MYLLNLSADEQAMANFTTEHPILYLLMLSIVALPMTYLFFYFGSRIATFFIVPPSIAKVIANVVTLIVFLFLCLLVFFGAKSA
ncbi:hypothetical protein [Macrococcus armenti]|uniref:hypothetical protein n=1 Tax=Macrococcus armenti TaxID=2875764 RepID=UPI001CCAB596|nr:hypothetical protein [Macrococcus armenti]UBH09788.1 hypothetical protein LAU41_11855 [Macrococcus armenti]